MVDRSGVRDAVVLVSGGLDSTTVLAIAKAEGYRINALSFRYGQRHAVELEAARRVVAAMGVERHVIADIDLRAFGGSALTDAIDVPKHDSAGELANDLSGGIPVTYVPARNTVFLSFALAWAETLGASDLFIGVNALDYSGYPDCRPEYIAAFETLANLATK
ncbi:7-cyano-7-deazaguanine synthase QueC, partial [Azospirillum sp. B506]|uniref:7-cyano-7-deazaguanine synthase QueC n=1 Tax=Azospirillum sp. B506 TaxID=137721 RepID=UPI0005B29128